MKVRKLDGVPPHQQSSHHSNLFHNPGEGRTWERLALGQWQPCSPQSDQNQSNTGTIGVCYKYKQPSRKQATDLKKHFLKRRRRKKEIQPIHIRRGKCVYLCTPAAGKNVRALLATANIPDIPQQEAGLPACNVHPTGIALLPLLE